MDFPASHCVVKDRSRLNSTRKGSSSWWTSLDLQKPAGQAIQGQFKGYPLEPSPTIPYPSSAIFVVPLVLLRRWNGNGTVYRMPFSTDLHQKKVIFIRLFIRLDGEKSRARRAHRDRAPPNGHAQLLLPLAAQPRVGLWGYVWDCFAALGLGFGRALSLCFFWRQGFFLTLGSL